MISATALRHIEEFLETCYDDGDLRTLISRVFEDNRGIVMQMPGSGASARDLARFVVMTMPRYYEAPPPALWDYLLETRPPRRQAIDELRQAFGLGPLPASEYPIHAAVLPLAPESGDIPWTRTIQRVEPRVGQFDLLAAVPLFLAGCARLPTEAPFSHFTAGRTNGLPREFVVIWRDLQLEIHAMPSLYRDGQVQPPHIVLTRPADRVEFKYFPRGKYHVDEATGAGVAYRFAVEAWNADERRLRLTDHHGHHLQFCLNRPEESHHEHS